MIDESEIGLGGNIVEEEVNEGIIELPNNRTMFINLFTAEEPGVPEVVDNIKKIDDLFRHFLPNIDIEFNDEEGQAIQENFTFENVGDFSPKSMTKRSPYLNDLSIRKEFYEKVTKQLRSNKVLQKVISDKDTKRAMLIILKVLKQELEETL